MVGVGVKSWLLQSNLHKKCLFKTFFCQNKYCYSTLVTHKPCISRFHLCSDFMHLDYMKSFEITLSFNKIACHNSRTFFSSSISSLLQGTFNPENQEQLSVLHDEILNNVNCPQFLRLLDSVDAFSHPMHVKSGSFQTLISQKATYNSAFESCQLSTSHSIHKGDSCVDNLPSWHGDDQALPSLVANKHHSFLEYLIPNVNAASDINAPDAYSWLSAYIHLFENLASSAPVLKLMTWLQDIHAVLGVPWWLSIILTTVALRTAITLPLALYQQHILARVELLRKEMMPLMQRLADETRTAKQQFDWDDRTAQFYFRKQCRKSWNELIVRDNCHPGKGVVLIVGQLPLWIMLSVSIRNLALCHPVANDAAVATQQQLRTEGLPWCADLSLSDASLVLPLSMALINIIITEIAVLQRPQVTTTAGVRRMTWVLRGMAVIVVPIAIYMPAGVVLYWVTSSGCALLQTLLLMHPRVRTWSGIPLTPSTQLHPYSRIACIVAMKIRGQEIPLESAPMSFELPPEKKKLK